MVRLVKEIYGYLESGGAEQQELDVSANTI